MFLKQLQIQNKILEILNQIKNKQILYISNNGNLGDALISYSTLQLFNNIRLKYDIYYQKANIDDYDVIIYGGGGKFVKYWLNKSEIDRFFKNDKIKILLSHSFYECQYLIDNINEKYSIFCRDPKSYEYMKDKCQNKTQNIFLCNDMAFSCNFSHLDFQNKIEFKWFPKKIDEYLLKNNSLCGSFIRTDVEKTILPTCIPNLDLSILGHCNNDYTIEKHENCIKPFLYAISKYETIITNRLHVAIAAWKLNKHVIVYDNSYGKVFNVLKYSLPNDPNIYFAN